MNRLTIIGNLTRDPELRTTQAGKTVCSFTVAVNRRQKDQNGQDTADFFRVSAWNQLGDNCAKYLAKGRKVAVVGQVSVHTYQGQDGKTYAQMDVMASEVEFLSAAQQAQPAQQGQRPQPVQQTIDAMSGMQVVETPDDLPF